MTDVVLNEEVKSAKIKSALIAVIPSSVVLITSIIFPFFKGQFVSSGIVSLILTTVTFGFVYTWTFYAFAKKLLPKGEEFASWEAMPDVLDRDEEAIDAINMGRGHGPGRGYIVPIEPTKIDWDSHHYR